MADFDKTIAGTMAGCEGALLAGRYRIVRQLGQGGMGSVWLAEDMQLDGKLFAIKMLPSILVSNKRAYRQLKDEALVAMKLVHPNIVTLRAFEENNGNPFLVMDYIDGQTLDDYLADILVGRVVPNASHGISESDVIRILAPVAAALDYAHGEGVVHRDVKPANVMIRKDGHPFVLDFGIAREIQETMTRVTGKLSSGTLLYMSPEQLNGAAPKPAQDVYSFAAMVYECLKGEPPFSRGQIEYQILNNAPEPLAGLVVPATARMVGRRVAPATAKMVGRVVPNAPRSIAASVMAGLAKKPEDRPPTCAAVLEWNASRRGAETQSAGLGGRVSSRAAAADGDVHTERKSGAALVAAAILAALVGGGLWWTGRQSPATPGSPGSAVAPSSPVTPAPPVKPTTVDTPTPSVKPNPPVAPTPPNKPNPPVAPTPPNKPKTSVSTPPTPPAPSPTWEEIQTAINDCNWKVEILRTGMKSKMDTVEPFRAMKGDFKDILGKIDENWNALKNLPKPQTIDGAKALPEKANAFAKEMDKGIKALWERRAFYVKQACGNAKRAFESSMWERCVAECDMVLGWDARNAEAKRLKSEAESHLVPTADPKHREEIPLKLPGNVEMKMIYVGPGDYVYGDAKTPMKMDHGFWLGKCEVTQAQWKKMVSALGLSGRFKDYNGDTMDPAPCWIGDNLPMDSVSWNDCQILIEALNRHPDYKHCNFRLPSEHEWEYACRAGTIGDYAGNIDSMAWYDENSGRKTHPVGMKTANSWGFCDMHGNVWEWCNDNHDASRVYRVLRGGCWYGSARDGRSANRFGGFPDSRISIYGFRLCCSALVPIANTAKSSAPVGSEAGPMTEETTVYIVQLGDTLLKIAKRYNLTMAAIKAVNPGNKRIQDGLVFLGQKIVLPGRIDVGEQDEPKGAFTAQPKPDTGVAKAYSGRTIDYVVKVGDTAGSIAFAHKTTVRAIAELNNIDPNRMRVGQILRIPVGIDVSTANAE